MEARDEELITTLAPQHDELRVAYEEHSRLKALVDQMGAKTFLTPEEEVKRAELKKLKLIEKDKIMRFLEAHRKGEVGASPA